MSRFPKLLALNFTGQILQADYTLGREVLQNPYHVSILRSQLTRSLGVLYPEIRDEIITTFDDVLDLKGNGEHLVPILVCW